MPYTKSKYSAAQTMQWRVAAMCVLDDATEALTCEEIRTRDLALVDVTPQKMARILNELVEGGFAAKTKGKDGRMRYKSIGVLIDQGYDIDSLVY